jgi:hypothetical protein
MGIASWVLFLLTLFSFLVFGIQWPTSIEICCLYLLPPWAAAPVSHSASLSVVCYMYLLVAGGSDVLLYAN